MLTSMFVNVSVAVSMAAPAANDPYPAKCDLYHMADPIIGWFIGEAKGLIPSIVFAVLMGASFAALFFSKRIQKASLRHAVIVVAIILLVGSMWNFAQAVAPSACLGQ